MTHIGVWEIGDDDAPRRLSVDREFLEKHLETWIERDPSLLGGDVRWVSRQLTLLDGSRLDLLGLTKDGTWVIVELKAGPVGVDTIRQALHYFLEIAGMTNGQLAQRIRSRGISDASVAIAVDELAPDAGDSDRDYLLLVAGVGSGESAEAAAAILERHGFDVPIQVVTFQLLRDSTGHRILLREVDERIATEATAPSSRWSLDEVLQLAERYGVREGFEAIRSKLLAQGFRAYQKKYGLNFNLGTRAQSLWVAPREGRIHLGYLAANFPALYGVDESQAGAEFGPNWIDLPPAEALQRIQEWAEIIAGYHAGQLASPAVSPALSSLK